MAAMRNRGIMTQKESHLTYGAVWGTRSRTLTAENNLDLVLGSTTHLPVKYWRKNFFFKGGRNEILRTLTRGEFPAKADPEGSHPVFALKPVLNHAGFVVCPCSSSGWKKRTWVNKGTPLLHTGYIMEKTTYIVDLIQFNFPASEALKLKFMGEVPEQAVQSIG